MLQFFRSEIQSRNAKLAVGLYSDGVVSNVISSLDDEMSPDSIADSFSSKYEELTCGGSTMGNIFDTFQVRIFNYCY